MKVTVDPLTGMPQIVNQEVRVYSSSGVINQGGGSGSSPLTSKGDVYTHSTVDTRLGVGADGTVLTADSSQATGLKWNAVSGTGTVTSVTSANSDATVATTTTTPVITVVSAPKLTTARTIGTLTGDVTTAGSSFDGSANNTNATVLATVNSNVGSFGSATQVPGYTVNAKGLITAASNTTIQIAESQVTSLTTDLAAKAPLASPTFTGHITTEGVTATGATGTGKLVFDGSPTLVTPNLGTPSAINLTNATGAPTWNQNTTGSAATLTTARNIAGVAFNGSANISLTSGSGIQKGDGSGGFTAATAGTDYQKATVVSTTAAPGATPTIAVTTNARNYVDLTAMAAAITSMTTNLSGTPARGDTLWISFTDDGTARAITWGTSFEASTVALPTTTVISTRLDVGFVWNTATSKWRCVAVA